VVFCALPDTLVPEPLPSVRTHHYPPHRGRGSWPPGTPHSLRIRGSKGASSRRISRAESEGRAKTPGRGVSAKTRLKPGSLYRPGFELSSRLAQPLPAEAAPVGAHERIRGSVRFALQEPTGGDFNRPFRGWPAVPSQPLIPLPGAL